MFINYLYWGIYDDYTVRKLEPRGNKPILIRILEPSYKRNNKIPYKIETIDKYIVLELYFDDISEYPPEKYKDRFVLFDINMAKKLVSFIEKHDFDEIVVHCSQGISRSSAIMVCISRILNLPEIEKTIYKCGRFKPNNLILNEFSKIKYNKKYTKCTLVNTNNISI